MAVKKEQVKSAAATYTTGAENERKPLKEKRNAISFYVRPSVYNEMKRLAQYRGISVGSLIDDILSAYLDKNREELNAYDALRKKFE